MKTKFQTKVKMLGTSLAIMLFLTSSCTTVEVKEETAAPKEAVEEEQVLVDLYSPPINDGEHAIIYLAVFSREPITDVKDFRYEINSSPWDYGYRRGFKLSVKRFLYSSVYGEYTIYTYTAIDHYPGVTIFSQRYQLSYQLKNKWNKTILASSASKPKPNWLN